MTDSPQTLLTVMYHYVRDVKDTEFPELKALDIDAFRAQVDYCASRYEMASLASALAFLSGEYQPERPLCLLTFDDGLADHYEHVTPILVDRGIQGVFFLTTGCIEEGFVLSVHKSHFLMAFLGFHRYRDELLNRLQALHPGLTPVPDEVRAGQTYRWDELEVATFKYLMNYQLTPDLRDEVLTSVFLDALGGEEEFAARVYLSWARAREMQAAGMSIGGHTHTHPVLSECAPTRQREEIERCNSLLTRRMGKQELLPFAYPYGKQTTFNSVSVDLLRGVGFACAFSTEVGMGVRGVDPFAVPRVDPKDLTMSGK